MFLIPIPIYITRWVDKIKVRTVFVEKSDLECFLQIVDTDKALEIKAERDCNLTKSVYSQELPSLFGAKCELIITFEED